MLQRITMENKIGEIVTLPPYDIEARVVEVKEEDCDGCYYQHKGWLCGRYLDNGVLGYCSYGRRKDYKNIIYKPLSAEEKEI